MGSVLVVDKEALMCVKDAKSAVQQRQQKKGTVVDCGNNRVVAQSSHANLDGNQLLRREKERKARDGGREKRIIAQAIATSPNSREGGSD